MSLNFSLEMEENLVTWTSIIKKNTFLSYAYDEDVALQQYSFIDVNGAKKLISRDDGVGNSVITDRAVLDSLLRIAKKFTGGHKFILCDIFFEKPTTDDQALAATVRSIPNIIFPAQYVNDSLQQPIISNLPVAFSGYNSSSGIGLSNKFLKYNLVEEDTLVTIPLRMYAALHGAEIKKKFGLVFINGRPAMNTMIVNIRVHESDLEDPQGFSKIIPIGEILALRNDSLIYELFLKDKIIVIGDFQGDLHDSIYGEMAGALLLVNMFEAIVREDVYIKSLLILLVLSGYGFLSYIIFFYEGGILETKFKQFSYPLIGAVGSRLIGFSFGLYILSIVAYFTFGIHLDILAMATYLSLVSILKRRLAPRANDAKQPILNLG